MGDAGSRPMGLLLGLLVMASGNPFLIFIVTGVVLVNGGTGLLKVALLRFFKIGIFRNVRYPLHDHVRKELGWSNTQVLLRFVLLQAIITPITTLNNAASSEAPKLSLRAARNLAPVTMREKRSQSSSNVLI